MTSISATIHPEVTNLSMVFKSNPKAQKEWITAGNKKLEIYREGKLVADVDPFQNIWVNPIKSTILKNSRENNFMWLCIGIMAQRKMARLYPDGADFRFWNGGELEITQLPKDDEVTVQDDPVVVGNDPLHGIHTYRHPKNRRTVRYAIYHYGDEYKLYFMDTDYPKGVSFSASNSVWPTRAECNNLALSICETLTETKTESSHLAIKALLKHSGK